MRSSINIARTAHWPEGLSAPVESKSLVASRKLLKKGILLLLAGLALAFLFVWSRIKVIQLGYEVSGLKGNISELSREVGQLRLNVAKKKTLERLSEEAVHLGLVRPTGKQVVFVDEK